MRTRWVKTLTAGLGLSLMSPVWADETVDLRPTTLDYRAGQPIPPGYRVVSRYHRAELTTGTILFGISYSVSVLLASARSEASAKTEAFAQVPYNPRWLFLPIVGPWVALATSFQSHDCQNSPYTSSYFYGQCEAAIGGNTDGWRALLVADGLVQGVGAALSVYGLESRWYQLVLTEDASAALQPVPMGHHGQGLALVGRFR